MDMPFSNYDTPFIIITLHVNYQATFMLCVVVSSTKTGEMIMDQIQWT